MSSRRYLIAALLILPSAYAVPWVKSSPNPVLRPDCNFRLAPTEIVVTSIDIHRESPEQLRRIDSRLRDILDHLANLDFVTPTRLRAIATMDEGRRLPWPDEHDSQATVEVDSGVGHIRVGRKKSMVGHEVAHVVLDLSLWNDRGSAVIAHLRERLDPKRAEISELERKIDAMDPYDRPDATEIERNRLQDRVHSLWRTIEDEQHEFFHSEYVSQLAELWTDLVTYADTGDPHTHPRHELHVLNLVDDPEELLSIRARSFAESFLVADWSDSELHRRRHNYFAPVRSYVGRCLAGATRDERYAYARSVYGAIRERLDTKFEAHGTRYEDWNLKSSPSENEALIEILKRKGGPI